MYPYSWTHGVYYTLTQCPFKYTLVEFLNYQSQTAKSYIFYAFIAARVLFGNLLLPNRHTIGDLKLSGRETGLWRWRCGSSGEAEVGGRASGPKRPGSWVQAPSGCYAPTAPLRCGRSFLLLIYSRWGRLQAQVSDFLADNMFYKPSPA